MKKLMILLALVAFIAGLSITGAEAADSAKITVRVTLSNLSVVLDTTEWNIGTVEAEQQVTKTGITVTNDGGADAKATIRVDNTGCYWTNADLIEENTYVMEFKTGEDFIAIIDSNPVPLIPLLAKDDSATFGLRWTAPTKNTAPIPEQEFGIIIVLQPAT